LISCRIALVDTEHGSASKYADLLDFDVLILDSLSHTWSGPAGVMEIKEQLAKRREYNDYTAWGPAGELQNRLVQAILRSDLHVIATMRATETIRTEHAFQFFVHLRKNWTHLQPEQRERFLLQAAAQLDAWAAQLRSEAASQRSVAHPPAPLPATAQENRAACFKSGYSDKAPV
jgi:hypothetical protein